MEFLNNTKVETKSSKKIRNKIKKIKMDNKFKIQEIYLKHKIISNDVLDGEEFIDLISDLRKINFNQKLSNFAESKRISL